MDQQFEKYIAIWIKEGRLRKGYTQQELADLTGISIRSVQRIENGEVVPREYTLRLLTEHLELQDMRPPTSSSGQEGTAQATVSPRPPDEQVIKEEALNKPRKLILSIGVGLFLILGTVAFIAQSPRFPETTFEAICCWAAIAVVYTVVLFRLWK